MICYRDMTFCPFYKECKDRKNCGRALTEDVREAARKWWGSHVAPIAMYCSEPECFKEIK